MTYREELISKHPEWSEREIQKHVYDHCPPGDMDINKGCFCDCDKCWDRVIPGTTQETISEKEEPHPESEISCDSCIHSEVCKFRADFIKALDIAKDAPDMFEVIIRCKYNL